MSMAFGMVISLFFNLCYHLLFKTKNIIKILLNLVFVLFFVTTYFGLLYLVNDGVVHIYFFIIVLLGFWLGNRKTKAIRYKSKFLLK